MSSKIVLLGEDNPDDMDITPECTKEKEYFQPGRSGSGWQVYDMGIDVLSKGFVDKAVEVGARVIGASAMMYTSAMNIRKLREEIDNRGLTGYLQLAVGGSEIEKGSTFAGWLPVTGA